MPRNPHKKRCQVPGCRAWAMRGQTRCRVHRDAELGPRGAGAPPGNLNALRHGAHSHPLTSAQLTDLARSIVDHREGLPDHLHQLVRSIHARVDDPLLTLAALRRVLPSLIDQVAALLLDAELRAYLAPLPSPVRDRIRQILTHRVRGGPEAQLQFLRRRKRGADRARQGDK